MIATFTRCIFLTTALCQVLVAEFCCAAEEPDDNHEARNADDSGSLLALSHKVHQRPSSRATEKEDYPDYSEFSRSDESQSAVALQTRAVPRVHTPFRQQGPDFFPHPQVGDVTGNVNLGCHYAFSARETPIYVSCPEACQYLAEVTTTDACVFKCVTPQECGQLDDINPEASVSDGLDHFCRKCFVPGCSKCQDGENTDRCAVCEEGYMLDPESGKCSSPLHTAVIIICSVVGIIFLVLVVWYLELLTRPVVNREGVLDGLAYRSRSKLHMPKEAPSGSGVVSDHPEGRRELWPLSTNIMTTNVAGPAVAVLQLSVRCLDVGYTPRHMLGYHWSEYRHAVIQPGSTDNQDTSTGLLNHAVGTHNAIAPDAWQSHFFDRSLPGDLLPLYMPCDHSA